MKKPKEKQLLITTEELAKRWSMNSGTIENWRAAKHGPKFLKLGKGASAPVRYRLADVEAYENKMIRGMR